MHSFCISSSAELSVCGESRSARYARVLRRFSGFRLFVTPQTIAHQAPLSVGFLQQVYWSGLPFPSPGDLPDPGIEPASPVSPALQVDSFPPEPPTKPRYVVGALKAILFNHFTQYISSTALIYQAMEAWGG